MANKPFKYNYKSQPQLRTNFISNATHMLSNDRKAYGSFNSPDINQQRNLVNQTNTVQPISEKTINPTHQSYQVQKCYYNPQLVPVMQTGQNKINTTNTQQLNRDPFPSLAAKVSANFQTNQFSYLHKQYGGDYQLSRNPEMLAIQEQLDRAERNGPTFFLGEKQPYKQPKETRETKLINQREKLSQELNLYNQQQAGTISFNYKHNQTDHLDVSYEKLLPSDILD